MKLDTILFKLLKTSIDTALITYSVIEAAFNYNRKRIKSKIDWLTNKVIGVINFKEFTRRMTFGALFS